MVTTKKALDKKDATSKKTEPKTESKTSAPKIITNSKTPAKLVTKPAEKTKK